MGVIKVLNSKSDLQAHSRALAIVSYDRPHTIFYYYPIATISLSCTVSQILQNLKRSRDSEHIPLVSKYHAMSTLVFICINQYMKFEVPIYSFTNYKDMIGAKFKKNGSRDPDHASFRSDLSPQTRIWFSLSPCKIWRFQLQPFQRYGCCPPKFKWFTWPDHAPFRDSLQFPRGLALATSNLPCKFDVSISAHYEGTKGDTK